MTSLYPNITIPDDPAAEKGESLESCIPLQWPGISNIDEPYIRTLITRLLSASYQSPHCLSLHALAPTTLMKLLRQAAVTLSNENNIVDVVVPHEGCVHVFGDIHGDLHSLVNALNQTGLPSETNNLVFAGDYVDRGPWGVEVLTIILFLKLWRPNSIYLLRGNHETTGCIQRYGFEEEVNHKYGSKMLQSFVNVFRQLPLVAVIRTLSPTPTTTSTAADTMPKKKKKKRQLHPSNNQSSHPQFEWSGPCLPGERRTIVMHGGLFRSQPARDEGKSQIAKLADLMGVSRRSDDPFGDMVEDVLWSDPQLSETGVNNNKFRGCGILFGRTTLDFFFKNNALHGLIRAHEGPDMRERRPDMPDMQEGYSIDMDVPSGYLITIFSAADYPAQQPRGNKGAFATLYGKSHLRSSILPHFTTFRRLDPPTNVELFQKAPSESCCTPRASIS